VGGGSRWVGLRHLRLLSLMARGSWRGGHCGQACHDTSACWTGHGSWGETTRKSYAKKPYVDLKLGVMAGPLGVWTTQCPYLAIVAGLS
jgi:hypothetical protein